MVNHSIVLEAVNLTLSVLQNLYTFRIDILYHGVMVRRIAPVLALSLILFFLLGSLAQADGPIVGEIRIWAGTSSPPDGWRICNGGSPLSTSTYSQLFSVIGYTYGGSGSSFTLPDIQGRVVVGQQALPEFDTIGETGGERQHTLTIAEMPAHNHELDYVRINAAVNTGNAVAYPYGYGTHWGIGTGSSGGGLGHNNLQPYIVLNYIIFTGVYLTPTPTPTATATATNTPTPTVTSTITPTATANTIYLPSVYTQTLSSGKVLTVPVQADVGQVITAGLVLSLIAVWAFDFLVRVKR